MSENINLKLFTNKETTMSERDIVPLMSEIFEHQSDHLQKSKLGVILVLLTTSHTFTRNKAPRDCSSI